MIGPATRSSVTNREELIDEIFSQAVGLSAADREKFLEQCGRQNGASVAVIDEVKALLTNYRSADEKQFLDQPLVSSGAQTLAVGQQFEGYKIIELIAEGGMGEVYLAEDTELKRKVALKLIKGHATKDILRRFQAERQILANLKHANIAQLYEAGGTADGVPFFAMEYVEGEPIDKFVAAHQLSLNERLKLFRTVCSAISYAHQNLVIHRDIKPGNILVTESGEPKLLDFGIAKLLEDGESADATQTMFRALTPQYASPEQIRGEPITTASDVYSLGILLYELLTGQRPYKLKSNTASEITKAICEQEPIRPSAVVGGQWPVVSDDGRGQLKTNPQSAIGNRQLKGDLDNIILKALRKEPERRYASVEQVSEDIRRHLEGLPVTASADTFSYRTSKFLKRHKYGVAAAAIIVTVLAAGIIATTVEARRANRRFNEARQLAHTILFEYHDEIATLPGSTKVRERMVKDTLQYLDNLSKDAGNDVSLLREIAAAYEKVSAVQGGTGGLPTQGRFVSLSNLGDTNGALQSISKAVAIRERLVSLDPGNRDLRRELAYTYAGVVGLYSLPGPPQKVIEYSDKAIPILEGSLAVDPGNRDLRYVLQSTYLFKAKALGNPSTPNLGDVKGAMEFLQKGQSILERLAADYPMDTEYQRSLGVVYNLANALASANGDVKGALQFSLKAAAVDQRLVEMEPDNATFKSELAVQTGNAGSYMLQLGDPKGALEKFKQALAIYESLIAADPNDAAIRRNAGVGYRNVGAATSPDNRADALQNFDQAVGIFAGLTAKDPNNADFRRQWAYTYLALSRFQAKANDLNAAIESAQEGIKIDEVLVASSPANVAGRMTLALLYRQMGDCLAAVPAKGNSQRWSTAKNAYEKSLEIYQGLKNQGTLAPADASKPDELAKEITKCEAALAK
jgi:non-specific serine/threonine protein kinase/serine/threonine-protein kinase